MLSLTVWLIFGLASIKSASIDVAAPVRKVERTIKQLAKLKANFLCASFQEHLTTADMKYWPAHSYSSDLKTICEEQEFKFQERLGTGTFGQVFRGIHLPTGRQLALKTIPLRHLDPEPKRALSLIRNEECIHAKLSHPNIAKFYCTFVKNNGDVVIVMELIEGLSLMDIVNPTSDVSSSSSSISSPSTSPILSEEEDYKSIDKPKSLSSDLMSTVKETGDDYKRLESPPDTTVSHGTTDENSDTTCDSTASSSSDSSASEVKSTGISYTMGDGHKINCTAMPSTPSGKDSQESVDNSGFFTVDWINKTPTEKDGEACKLAESSSDTVLSSHSSSDSSPIYAYVELQRWSKQLLQVLGYLHSLDIVYADVKLENLLIDRYENLRLIDFGLSTCWSGPKRFENCFVGTPLYMSPEHLQSEGAIILPACDWYSAGLVLYEMLYKRDPFAGAISSDTDMVTYMLELTAHVTTTQLKCPKTMHPLLADLIEKLSATRPEDRIGYDSDMEARAINGHPLPENRETNYLASKELTQIFAHPWFSQ